MDAQHVGNLPPAVLSFAARHTLVVGMVQTGNQFAAKLAHGHGIDAVLDGMG